MVGPNEAVVRAFGRRGEATRLPGGQGDAWLVDGAVLKRHGDAAEAVWVQELASRLEPTGFRLPAPTRATDGSWVHDGWTATEHLPGLVPAAPDWDTVIAAGRAFAAAAAEVALEPGPALTARTHCWAVADRVAWGEEDVALAPPAAALLAALRPPTPPPHGPATIVHADLAGNVHVDGDGVPVVLDLSPYLRPARWGDAVVVADAVTWHEAGPGLALDFADDPAGRDLLGRALAFRLVAEQLGEQAGDPAAIEPYERIAALLT
ncbi:MAG TPA: hypothetical protein P5254_04785 [Aquihabitans sp.]|nr:hypothetical protein [Aquihabitans sp.]